MIFRNIVVITLVLSFFALGVCDLSMKGWRLGIVSLLLGIVQALIFWRPS